MALSIFALRLAPSTGVKLLVWPNAHWTRQRPKPRATVTKIVFARLFTRHHAFSEDCPEYFGVVIPGATDRQATPTLQRDKVSDQDCRRRRSLMGGPPRL